MYHRKFRLDGAGVLTCLTFLVSILVVFPVMADRAPAETKKPGESLPATQPGPEKQTNALPSTAGDPAAILPQNSDVTTSPGMTEEERAMIYLAIEDLREYVGKSSTEILENTTRSADALSRKVDETLSARLDLIERTLARSQQRHLDALRGANQGFLMQAGLFGALGFLGIIIAAVVLARAINRLSKAALALPSERLLLDQSRERAAIEVGDLKASLPAQFEQSSARFAETVERLLKRLEEWEQTMGKRVSGDQNRPAAKRNRALPSDTLAGGADAAQARSKAHSETFGESAPSAANDAYSEVSVLLGRGQALLNVGQTREAMECFDKAITLDPKNPGALINKGLALEKLRKTDQALEYYDRAIALDDSLTVAHLYKGAVFSKLQRFPEALACYERALKAEQKMVAL